MRWRFTPILGLLAMLLAQFSGIVTAGSSCDVSGAGFAACGSAAPVAAAPSVASEVDAADGCCGTESSGCACCASDTPAVSTAANAELASGCCALASGLPAAPGSPAMRGCAGCGCAATSVPVTPLRPATEPTDSRWSPVSKLVLPADIVRPVWIAVRPAFEPAARIHRDKHRAMLGVWLI